MPEPDPLGERSGRAFRAFSLYLRWYFSRNFRAVRVTRSGLPADPPGRPLIVCSNHPGWWDPAMFILMMATLLPQRIGFGPMDAAALRQYGLLRRMGVFGIDPESPQGARDFMRVGLRVLSEPTAVLFVTAEGGFTDNRSRPVHLRAGIAHLARRVPHAVVLPLALEYPFWNERRPEALAHFGAPVRAGGAGTVEDWTTALKDALTGCIDSLAAASMRRDPTLFHDLIHGQTGVGGIYDVWRQGKAIVRRERFNPGHERPSHERPGHERVSHERVSQEGANHAHLGRGRG